MGVTGLLKVVRDLMTKLDMKSLNNKSVAIDASNWLYIALYGCYFDMMTKPQEANCSYIQKCIKKIFILQNYGARVTVVFDGYSIDAKSETHVDRSSVREANLAAGWKLLGEGKVAEARTKFSNATKMSFKHRANFIRVLRHYGIPYVVAPYEADAQLFWMSENGLADFVITGDSDLIMYGCERIIYDFDDSGRGWVYKKKYLPRCKSVSFSSVDLLRKSCILSGCDYFKGICGYKMSKISWLLHTRSVKDTIKYMLENDRYSDGREERSLEQLHEQFTIALRSVEKQVIFNMILDECERLNSNDIFETDHFIKYIPRPNNSSKNSTNDDDELFKFAGRVGIFASKGDAIDFCKTGCVDEKGVFKVNYDNCDCVVIDENIGQDKNQLTSNFFADSTLFLQSPLPLPQMTGLSLTYADNKKAVGVDGSVGETGKRRGKHFPYTQNILGEHQKSEDSWECFSQEDFTIGPNTTSLSNSRRGANSRLVLPTRMTGSRKRSMSLAGIDQEGFEADHDYLEAVIPHRKQYTTSSTTR